MQSKHYCYFPQLLILYEVIIFSLDLKFSSPNNYLLLFFSKFNINYKKNFHHLYNLNIIKIIRCS